MFSLSPRSVLPGLLMLALLPAGLAAQQAPTAPPAEGPPAEVQGWLVELQQIHTRLESIQQRALEDSALNAAQESLGESIRVAMSEIDPTLEQGMDRIRALETQAEAAQSTGDEAKLQELGAEAQQIQQKFVSAQQEALQQPELATRVIAFQGQLEQKMLEVDPEVETLMARFQELQEKLAAVMQSGAPRD